MFHPALFCQVEICEAPVALVCLWDYLCRMCDYIYIYTYIHILCKVFKCINIMFLFIGVHPSYLRRKDTNLWLTPEQTGEWSLLYSLCSVYQNLYGMFSPNRVHLCFSHFFLGGKWRGFWDITNGIFRFHQHPTLGCYVQVLGTCQQSSQITQKNNTPMISVDLWRKTMALQRGFILR